MSDPVPIVFTVIEFIVAFIIVVVLFVVVLVIVVLVIVVLVVVVLIVVVLVVIFLVVIFLVVNFLDVFTRSPSSEGDCVCFFVCHHFKISNICRLYHPRITPDPTYHILLGRG